MADNEISVSIIWTRTINGPSHEQKSTPSSGFIYATRPLLHKYRVRFVFDYLAQKPELAHPDIEQRCQCCPRREIEVSRRSKTQCLNEKSTHYRHVHPYVTLNELIYWSDNSSLTSIFLKYSGLKLY
jgi:hypothetical protein